MPPARRDETPPETVVAESTTRDVSHELEQADPTRLALLRAAEYNREQGPRQTVLDRVARRQAELDQQHIDAGAGIDRSEADHYAALWGIDYSIMRPTFEFLGRQRVPEDELRAAIAHVGSREV